MADFYSFLPIPCTDQDRIEAVKLMNSNGAKMVRLTIINEHFERPPYPHGAYFEGWLESNEVEPPFDFPLTETPPA